MAARRLTQKEMKRDEFVETAVDAGQWLEGCLESLWRAAEVSHSRVVLGLTDPRDPALEVVQEALAGVERPPTELRIDPGPAGLNRKMANLIQMTEGLKADILLFSDADVRVPEDYVEAARWTRLAV